MLRGHAPDLKVGPTTDMRPVRVPSVREAQRRQAGALRMTRTVHYWPLPGTAREGRRSAAYPARAQSITIAGPRAPAVLRRCPRDRERAGFDSQALPGRP